MVKDMKQNFDIVIKFKFNMVLVYVVLGLWNVNFDFKGVIVCSVIGVSKVQVVFNFEKVIVFEVNIFIYCVEYVNVLLFQGNKVGVRVQLEKVVGMGVDNFWEKCDVVMVQVMFVKLK